MLVYYLELLKREHNVVIGCVLNGEFLNEITQEIWTKLLIKNSNKLIEQNEFLFFVVNPKT